MRETETLLWSDQNAGDSWILTFYRWKLICEYVTDSAVANNKIRKLKPWLR